jgi:hypothetical protein
VQPGNSCGAPVDERGHVVDVVSAKPTCNFALRKQLPAFARRSPSIGQPGRRSPPHRTSKDKLRPGSLTEQGNAVLSQPPKAYRRVGKSPFVGR